MWNAARILREYLAKSDAKILHFPLQPRMAKFRSHPKRSGPGSRGGHVLGTTASGKPIYSNEHETHDAIFRMGSYSHSGKGISLPPGQAAKASIASHKGWTAKEHIEAFDAHLKDSKSLEDVDQSANAARVAGAHLHAAKKLSR